MERYKMSKLLNHSTVSKLWTKNRLKLMIYQTVSIVLNKIQYLKFC